MFFCLRYLVTFIKPRNEDQSVVASCLFVMDYWSLCSAIFVLFAKWVPGLSSAISSNSIIFTIRKHTFREKKVRNTVVYLKGQHYSTEISCRHFWEHLLKDGAESMRGAIYLWIFFFDMCPLLSKSARISFYHILFVSLIQHTSSENN